MNAATEGRPDPVSRVPVGGLPGDPKSQSKEPREPQRPRQLRHPLAVSIKRKPAKILGKGGAGQKGEKCWTRRIKTKPR